jgi:hypothetical protein
MHPKDPGFAPQPGQPFRKKYSKIAIFLGLKEKGKTLRQQRRIQKMVSKRALIRMWKR